MAILVRCTARTDGARKPYARPALIKRDRLALVSGIAVLSGVEV